MASLRHALAERQQQLASSEGARRAAVDRLRLALVHGEPGMRPEMLSGDTVADVESSFAAARQLLAEIRESVRQANVVAVPAGAPGRVPSSPSTPFEKIRAGLTRLAS